MSIDASRGELEHREQTEELEGNLDS